jgi:hypothetical protein
VWQVVTVPLAVVAGVFRAEFPAVVLAPEKNLMRFTGRSLP